MAVDFDTGLNADIIRDDHSIVRAVLHTQRPLVTDLTTARQAAESYLRSVGNALGIDAKALTTLDQGPHDHPVDADVTYAFEREKKQFNLTTVTFQQMCFGLPVWQAGISVHVNQEAYQYSWARQLFYEGRYYLTFGKLGLPAAFRVVGLQTTRHDKIIIADDGPHSPAVALLRGTAPSLIEPKVFAQQLGIGQGRDGYDGASLTIEHQRLMVYQYWKAKRTRGLEPERHAAADPSGYREMPLPPLPAQFVDGSHYIVMAVYFSLGFIGREPLAWVALVEIGTLSVLYLELLAAGINGKVYLADPMTTHNGPLPSATAEELNRARAWAVLPNLDPTAPQQLFGSNVKVVNFDFRSQPQFDPPTEPAGDDFEFEVPTDAFAAVNAYFHCDRFFGLMQSLGFERGSYFAGTDFPIQVDHRGWPIKATDGNSVGAECRPRVVQSPDGRNVTVGIYRVVFALARARQHPPQVGIANDWRVVLHELGGHGTLQNHVNSSFFGFAHSAGDSLAAILNDPESNAADRGSTFPWIAAICRRHDRTVEDGWGWDGPQDRDDGRDQFNREQILSTTHFRLYQSLGGGNLDQVAMRQFAARYTAYLILRAIMTLAPSTNPQHASDWMSRLIVTDSEDWTSEGQAGGAYEKVIRWVFEKQNLFNGVPPAVDVYIDDGDRNGEYAFQKYYAGCLSVWNRLAGDGIQGHQTPVPNVVNHAYVKIKNRGSELATAVSVRAFSYDGHAIERVYPDGWTAMSPRQRLAADILPQGPELTVGPFEWIPSAGDNFILMEVSARGDRSNLDKFPAEKPVPEWRLVPNDNNLGLRKV